MLPFTDGNHQSWTPGADLSRPDQGDGSGSGDASGIGPSCHDSAQYHRRGRRGGRRQRASPHHRRAATAARGRAGTVRSASFRAFKVGRPTARNLIKVPLASGVGDLPVVLVGHDEQHVHGGLVHAQFPQSRPLPGDSTGSDSTLPVARFTRCVPADLDPSYRRVRRDRRVRGARESGVLDGECDLLVVPRQGIDDALRGGRIPDPSNGLEPLHRTRRTPDFGLRHGRIERLRRAVAIGRPRSAWRRLRAHGSASPRAIASAARSAPCSCGGVAICGGSITSSAKRPSILRHVFNRALARPPGSAR